MEQVSPGKHFKMPATLHLCPSPPFVRAACQLEPGQPILLRYGRHSNRDLLLSYGFLTPPPNPFDAYTSPLDVDSTLVRCWAPWCVHGNCCNAN